MSNWIVEFSLSVNTTNKEVSMAAKKKKKLPEINLDLINISWTRCGSYYVFKLSPHRAPTFLGS
jgi:hypothetical protein